MHIARIASRVGQSPARAHRDAIERLYVARDWLDMWMVIDSLAVLLAEAGRVEPAAVLLGHLQAHKIQYPLGASRRAAATRLVDARADAADWLARGARLDRHELVAYALDALGNEP
jgi:hypothetical protein